MKRGVIIKLLILCFVSQFITSSNNQLAEKVRLRLQYEEAKRR